MSSVRNRWVRQAQDARPGENRFATRDDVRRLEKDGVRLRMERDIVKKCHLEFNQSSQPWPVVSPLVSESPRSCGGVDCTAPPRCLSLTRASQPVAVSFPNLLNTPPRYDPNYLDDLGPHPRSHGALWNRNRIC